MGAKLALEGREGRGGPSGWGRGKGGGDKGGEEGGEEGGLHHGEIGVRL